MADQLFTYIINISFFVAFCLHVVGFLVRNMRSSFKCKALGAFRALRSVLSRLRLSLASTVVDQEDPIASLVQRQMKEEQVNSMRTMASYFAHVCFFFTATVLFNIYQGNSRWMSPGQDVVAIFATIFYTLLYLFPCLIQPRSVPLVYVCQWLIPIFLIMFMPQDEFAVLGTFGLVLSVRFPFNLTCLDMVLVTVGNLLNSGVCCIIFWFVAGKNVRTLAIFEVCFSAVIIATVRSLWKTRMTVVRQKILAATLESQSDALTLLLKLMCDVVVELDHNLCLTKDSPQLSAILTLDGRSLSLKGRQMKDFMASDEDRLDFEQRLLEPLKRTSSEDLLHPGSMPGAFRVKVRDSLGNILNMELFYALGESIGQRRFYLGLREQAHEPVAQLREFARSKHSRRSRRAARITLSNHSSSSSERDNQSASDSDEIGRPMNALWRCVGEKGKALVLLQALQKCNIQVRPGKCCAWHAAVSSMKKMLNTFEDYQCALAFSVNGDWQCAECLSIESSVNPLIDDSSGKYCTVCCTYAASRSKTGIPL